MYKAVYSCTIDHKIQETGKSEAIQREIVPEWDIGMLTMEYSTVLPFLATILRTLLQ